MAEKIDGIVTVTWVDTTNIAGWQTQDELKEFATDGAWVCRNTGWISYQDNECVVVSSRRSESGHWVLSVRIPCILIVKVDQVTSV